MNKRIIEIHKMFKRENNIEHELMEKARDVNFIENFLKIQSQHKANQISMEKIEAILNRQWIDPINDYWGALYQRINFCLLIDNAFNREIKFKYLKALMSVDREIMDLVLMYQLGINGFNFQQTKMIKKVHDLDRILTQKDRKSVKGFNLPERMKRLTYFLFKNQKIDYRTIVDSYARPFRDLQVKEFEAPQRAKVMNYFPEGNIETKNPEKIKKMNCFEFEKFAIQYGNKVVNKYNEGKTRFHSYYPLKASGWFEGDRNGNHYNFGDEYTNGKIECDAVFWEIETKSVLLFDAKNYSYEAWLSRFKNYGANNKGFTNMLTNSMYHGELFKNLPYQCKVANSYSLVYIFKEDNGSLLFVDMSTSVALGHAMKLLESEKMLKK